MMVSETRYVSLVASIVVFHSVKDGQFAERRTAVASMQSMKMLREDVPHLQFVKEESLTCRVIGDETSLI